MSRLPRPSAFRIILTDTWSGYFFFQQVLLWGIFTLTRFGLWQKTNGEWVTDFRYAAALAIISTVVCGPLLIWRIQRIRSLFEHGVAVPATITGLDIWRLTVRVGYEYKFRDHLYRKSMAVTTRRLAALLDEGTKFTVLLDPEKPIRSILADPFGVRPFR